MLGTTTKPITERHKSERRVIALERTCVDGTVGRGAPTCRTSVAVELDYSRAMLTIEYGRRGAFEILDFRFAVRRVLRCFDDLWPIWNYRNFKSITKLIIKRVYNN